MSSFACQECGQVISDTPNGYVTGCEHWPLKKIENYSERAAIMEYEAGMNRAEAERRARAIVSDKEGA